MRLMECDFEWDLISDQMKNDERGTREINVQSGFIPKWSCAKASFIDKWETLDAAQTRSFGGG
jgi:hypothetical protein